MGKRLLVIDDDPAIRKLVARLFADTDFELSVADDCVDLGAEIRRLQPDVILIDVNLPSSNAFSLVERARYDTCTSRFPIVVGWTADDPPTSAAFRSAGFDAFLAKPIDITRLVQRLEWIMTATAVDSKPR